VSHDLLQALAIFAAGLAAGTINAAVGSGTLITFPTLLAFGYPPVLANVSNNIGLVPGGVSGVYGYRRELGGQGRRIARLVPASVAGGVVGAVLLLVLPGSVFKRVVVVLIVIALILVLAQPWLARRLGDRHGERTGPLLVGCVFAVGVYGGYFGAAQGIMLLAILGLALDDDLQRINAVKVVLAGLVNLVSGVIFAFAAHVSWDAAGLIAVGSIIGGVLGARYGRRLPAPALRLVIIAVGILAIVRLL
jgi:uncharacterized membrane protein YfcA